MERYILTLDEGTTSARAVLFDKNGDAVTVAQNEFTQIYPREGWVEHDPVEIFSSQYSAMTEAVIKAGINPSQIAALGITNQRETVIMWDKITGEPVCNAIVWQCRRTADICEQLRRDGYEEYIKNTTGLKIDAYFSATKIKWILDNVNGARERAVQGQLLFGTVDTWLMWKLSDGKIHATDRTNASRTMLYDIHNLCWDKKLLEILDIPECILPQVLPSGAYFGDIDIMGAQVPICGVAGDQQSALFGQKCFGQGDIKNTYGTGCFLLMNTGGNAVQSKNGLLTTVAATLSDEDVQYALEGSVFIGGAVVQWLRDELCLIKTAAESEECAVAVNDSGGVYIVPAFAGLGAPYWDMYARGTVCGLTRGSNKNHIVRAALESIAYQTDDLIRAMRQDSNLSVGAMRVDGGASRNGFLMQFQSDISDIDVIRPAETEATALGAAYLAGLYCGFFEGKDALTDGESTVFRPRITDTERQLKVAGWRRAVNSTKTFSLEEE